MATQYHAEHVGSLLRPPYLLRAREAFEAGTVTMEELREVEDRAITELIDVQHERAMTLGARLLYDRSHHPQEPLRVYADPAGHLFCIFVAPS